MSEYIAIITQLQRLLDVDCPNCPDFSNQLTHPVFISSLLVLLLSTVSSIQQEYSRNTNMQELICILDCSLIFLFLFWTNVIAAAIMVKSGYCIFEFQLA